MDKIKKTNVLLFEGNNNRLAFIKIIWEGLRLPYLPFEENYDFWCRCLSTDPIFRTIPITPHDFVPGGLCSYIYMCIVWAHDHSDATFRPFPFCLHFVLLFRSHKIRQFSFPTTSDCTQ